MKGGGEGGGGRMEGEGRRGREDGRRKEEGTGGWKESVGREDGK